jgi:arginine/ornithine N-succinyltransferase beta subunit
MLPDSAKTLSSAYRILHRPRCNAYAWRTKDLLGKITSISFDGGPTMTARTDQIRSIRDAKDVIITAVSDDVGEHKSGQKKLITLGHLHAFKAAYGWIDDTGDNVIIDSNCARTLGISAGDAVTYVERA